MSLTAQPTASTQAKRSIAALILVASGLVLSPSAHAQWIVSDPATEIATQFTQVSTTTSQIEAASEYVQTAARWKATWDHYYQQIARFMNTVRNPMLTSKVPFETLPLDYGVSEKCGSAAGGGFSLSALASSVLPDFSGDIAANQRKICAQIQMLENNKHNVLVEYAKKIAPSLAQDLEQINTSRAQNNAQGTLQAIQEASARLEVQTRQSDADLENQIKACDMMIGTLTRMQKVLAQRALKGQPDPVLGTLVKTTALQAALKVGK